MKAYESFSEWKNDQLDKNQKLITALQRLIKKTAPHFTTTVKWGQGCWVNENKPRVYIHAEDDGVQLGFYNGSSLKDPQDLLEGQGKFVRFIRIHTSKDIDAKAFADLILQVA